MIFYDERKDIFLEKLLAKAEMLVLHGGQDGYSNAIEYLHDKIREFEDLNPHEVYINGDMESVNEVSTYALDTLSSVLYDFCDNALKHLYEHLDMYECALEERGY